MGEEKYTRVCKLEKLHSSLQSSGGKFLHPDVRENTLRIRSAPRRTDTLSSTRGTPLHCRGTDRGEQPSAGGSCRPGRAGRSSGCPPRTATTAWLASARRRDALAAWRGPAARRPPRRRPGAALPRRPDPAAPHAQCRGRKRAPLLPGRGRALAEAGTGVSAWSPLVPGRRLPWRGGRRGMGAAVRAGGVSRCAAGPPWVWRDVTHLPVAAAEERGACRAGWETRQGWSSSWGESGAFLSPRIFKPVWFLLEYIYRLNGRSWSRRNLWAGPLQAALQTGPLRQSQVRPSQPSCGFFFAF